MYDPSLHLFVDDFHIRNAFLLNRTFFPLQQDHRAVLTDTDGRYIGWGSAMFDQGKYRMWYQSVARSDDRAMQAAGVYGRGAEMGYFPDRYAGAIPATQLSMIGYAESSDGLEWRRPDLGIVEWNGSKKNNMVFDGSGPAKQFDRFVTNMDSVSVVRDDGERDPAKRYKMINHWETIHCWDDRAGIERPGELKEKFWAHRAKYLTTSPDGIHFEPTITWIKAAEGGDYCGVTRDERNGRWWFADRPMVGLGAGYYRLAGLSVSGDLYHWPEHLEQVMFPGEFEDYGERYQHHGWTPFNYGDQDLAVLELSIGGRPVMGILCSHRDGERWKILNHDVPVLSAGRKGENDDQIVAVTRNGPFAVGERLRFYYNGRGGNYTKLQDRFGGIFIGEMRLDGFAGLTVDEVARERAKKTAVLLTRALRVRNDSLEINIAGHRGSARVALLDDSMTAIPGFDVTDCLPIAEDATRASVKWKNRADLSAIEGHDVHVAVHLLAGTIYSVRL